jgi:hypothetical protein
MAEQPVSFADEAAQWASNEERRASERQTSARAARCQSVRGAADSSRTRIRDVSAFGIGLVLPHDVEPGAVLTVEVDPPDTQAGRPILARVVHTTALNSNEWLVGCAFISELDDVTLNVYQAARVRSTTSDCRTWVRFPCNVETICYSCYSTPGERVPARILNISAGGVGLLTPCEFEKGTLLSLALPGPANRPARKSLVRVLHVRDLHNGDWFLGCEFAEQLNADEIHRWV